MGCIAQEKDDESWRSCDIIRVAPLSEKALNHLGTFGHSHGPGANDLGKAMGFPGAKDFSEVEIPYGGFLK